MYKERVLWKLFSCIYVVVTYCRRRVNLKRRCPRCWNQNSSAPSPCVTPEAFSPEKKSKKVFFFSFVVLMCTSSCTSALPLLRLPHFIQTVVSFSSDTFLRHEGPGRLEQRNDGEGINGRWSGPRKHAVKSHLFN